LILRALIKFGLAVLLSVVWAPFVRCAQPEASSAHPAQVRFIHIKGAHAFSAGEIKKILTTKEKWFRWLTSAPLDEKAFEEDLERIEKYYVSQGFYHARVVSHRIVHIIGNEVRIEIQIEEGPPMMVSEVNLSIGGDGSDRLREKLRKSLPLHPGDRFTTSAYQDIEKVLLAYFGDRGYPKARVDLRARLDKRSNRASVTVDVDRGVACVFGPIVLKGNESVSDDVILRELTFKPGDRFDASRAQESQQRLFNLDLFQFVDLTVENVEGDATSLPVHILIKEAKKQTVRVGAGYGTEDDFRGQAQWEIRNFLGGGRRLQVSGKASSLVQFVEGKLLQPYLWGPRSSLTVNNGVRHEDQQSFENRKIFLSPVVTYNWSEWLKSYLGYDLETNRLLKVSVEPQDLGPADQENQEFFISSLVAGTSWEHVDAPLDPKEGWRLIQNVEWATSGLGSEVDYVKLTLEGRGYVPVAKYGILAAKLKWGGIGRLEDTGDIPIFKRFFAGGSDSVRGYPYQRLGPLDKDGNAIGGMTLLEGSLEWRFPIRKSFEGVAFVDFGNVYEKSFDLVWDHLRYAAGCGLRYLTLVGPLRLDFGYELNPPEQSFFNPYQIHFSIGQAF